MKKIANLLFIMLSLITLNTQPMQAKSYGKMRENSPRMTFKHKEEILDQRVEEGKITQQQADDILLQMQECDGTGIHREEHLGLGLGQGNRDGIGQGNGKRHFNCQ